MLEVPTELEHIEAAHAEIFTTKGAVLKQHHHIAYAGSSYVYYFSTEHNYGIHSARSEIELKAMMPLNKEFSSELVSFPLEVKHIAIQD